jgi:hypothetical protein
MTGEKTVNHLFDANRVDERPRTTAFGTTFSKPFCLQNGLQFRNSKIALVYGKNSAKTKRF